METTVQQATLSVPDISCGHCEATVKQAVGALDGVQAVDASAETQEVVVSFDPNRVGMAQIAAALGKAGYPVEQ